MPTDDPQDDRPPGKITVLLEASGDHAKDRRKLTRIHNALGSYPGKDSFVIVIQRAGKTMPLAFPEQTTHICPELQRDLEEIVGNAAIAIDAPD